jgi:hypothetical protein
MILFAQNALSLEFIRMIMMLTFALPVMSGLNQPVAMQPVSFAEVDQTSL